MNILKTSCIHSQTFQWLKYSLISLCLTLLSATATNAEVSISDTPLRVTQSVPSLMMLNVSKDHQLFFQAYTDYADLDGDGAPNTTYTNNLDYYGYFDSYKCYDYSSGVFVPASNTTNKYCSGNWSGNFLNWLTMARIDVVRKILYGGYRSTDSSSQTILERSYLPNDAHSWVRFYDGSDINQLTPFPLPTATTTTSSSNITIPVGDRNDSGRRRTFATSWTSNNQVQIGDQIIIEDQSNPANKRMTGVVRSRSSGNVEIQITDSTGAGQSGNAWNLTNNSRRGVSFCNTTVGSGSSQNVTSAPLLRVAQGDYSLWTANERWQCRWSAEATRGNHAGLDVAGLQSDNANVYSSSGLFANFLNPIRSVVALGSGDYTVRVEVCNSSLIGQENCKQYPSENHKPIGLLQRYADEGNIHFGLLTGSYTKNLSGGVLRKNIREFNNEVNPATGQFITPSEGGSIVGSLNALRMYGYNHASGEYSGADDSCSAGVRKNQMADGKCMSWGNPQSELFLESLRYFAGKSATSAFAVSGTDKLPGLTSVNWVDPLSNENWCAVSSIVNFNASVSSFDGNQLGGASDIGASSVDTWTNTVGAGEDLNGQSRFFGGSNALCTPKTVGSLSGVSGLCPEAPNQDGTFHIAGLAHYAHTESIRTDLRNNDDETVDIHVKTYGVTLAPAVPRINIPLPGQTETAVTILPACENASSTDGGLRCALSAFRIVEQDIAAGTGKFFIQWDVHEWGSDFDMDINGTLSYVITNNNITVTTQTWAESSSRNTGFGYIISGTTKDGYHAHSGIKSYNYTDPTGALGCSNCNVNAAPTSYTYTLSGTVAQLLREPAFYAAKWGGYRKSDGIDFPSKTESWDSDSDGLPDNYFFAIDPAKLAESIAKVFATISDQRATAAAAVSAGQLGNGSVIFTVGYDSEDWSGELKAYRVENYQSIYSGCEAGSKLPFNPSRKIFTTGIDYIPGEDTEHSTDGIILNFSQLDDLQKTALNADDNLGAERISWLKSTTTHASFRDRKGKLLGDIVSSNSQLVAKRYREIARSLGAPAIRSELPEVIYVGSNGGMLHAFKAQCDDGDCSTLSTNCGGILDELFAFVPGELLSPSRESSDAPINVLMAPDYVESGKRFFVDGTPTIGEAQISGNWRRVLVGTMGAGGRSVFALDVTDPENFSENQVLWEFSDPDLGYGVHEAKIARMQDGTWVAIFGNGYNSQYHRAMLFIVNLATGELVAKIDTGVGSADNPNGLSIPTVTYWSKDTPETDVKAQAIYAGDLFGNLWRFNVAGGSFNETKIFTAVNGAGEAQPITSAPYVAPISKDDGNYALIVSFGTGSFFRTKDGQDTPDAPIQSLYGIVDDSTSLITRANLEKQEIKVRRIETFETAGPTDNSFTITVLSNNEVDLSEKNGWYLDLGVVNGALVTDGERVINGPKLIGSRIQFSTFVPNPDNDPCSPSATGFTMDFDLRTGGRTDNSIFDLNGDGVFDQNDLVEILNEDGEPELVAVSGIQFGTGEEIIFKGTADDPSYGRGIAGNAEISKFGVDLEGEQGGRQSWQQLR